MRPAGGLQNCTFDFAFEIGPLRFEPIGELAERIRHVDRLAAEDVPDAFFVERRIARPGYSSPRQFRLAATRRAWTAEPLSNDEMEQWHRLAAGVLSFADDRFVLIDGWWYPGPIENRGSSRILQPALVQNFCNCAAGTFPDPTETVVLDRRGGQKARKREVIVACLEHYTRSYQRHDHFAYRFFWAWTAFDTLVKFLVAEWRLKPTGFLKMAEIVLTRAGMHLGAAHR